MECTPITNGECVSGVSHQFLRQGFESLSKVPVALLDLPEWKKQTYLWESFEKPYHHADKDKALPSHGREQCFFHCDMSLFFQENKMCISLLVQVELS